MYLRPLGNEYFWANKSLFSPFFSQIYPGAVELMQVIEEFIHIVGLGMKDFHNAYLMTGNLGENQTVYLAVYFSSVDSDT